MAASSDDVGGEKKNESKKDMAEAPEDILSNSDVQQQMGMQPLTVELYQIEENLQRTLKEAGDKIKQADISATQQAMNKIEEMKQQQKALFDQMSTEEKEQLEIHDPQKYSKISRYVVGAVRRFDTTEPAAIQQSTRPIVPAVDYRQESLKKKPDEPFFQASDGSQKKRTKAVNTTPRTPELPASKHEHAMKDQDPVVRSVTPQEITREFHELAKTIRSNGHSSVNETVDDKTGRNMLQVIPGQKRGRDPYTVQQAGSGRVSISSNGKNPDIEEMARVFKLSKQQAGDPNPTCAVSGNDVEVVAKMCLALVSSPPEPKITPKFSDKILENNVMKYCANKEELKDVLDAMKPAASAEAKPSELAPAAEKEEKQRTIYRSGGGRNDRGSN